MGINPVAYRQTVRYDSGSNILTIDVNAVVQCRLSEVTSKYFTAAGITVTGDSDAALISQVADQWRAEDLSALAAQDPAL